jgi:hypothetical protein
MPSLPFRAEREGTRRFSDGEGEVGFAFRRSICGWGFPHLTPTFSAPWGEEGDHYLLLDDLQDSRQVFHHIVVPEANHPVSVAANLPTSICIFLLLDCMLPAVEFDSQLRRRTRKVNDVTPYRVLAAEPVPDPEFTQLPP